MQEKQGLRQELNEYRGDYCRETQGRKEESLGPNADEMDKVVRRKIKDVTQVPGLTIQD